LAVVQPAISVLPAQLLVPAGPLLSGTRLGVTIRNNTPGSVSVTNAAFSVPGVETQLREFQQGRIYSLVLTFPPGFEVPTGQKAELTFTTSHPQYPTMRVPLAQMPPPVRSRLISPGSAVNPMLSRTPQAASSNLSQNLSPLPPMPPLPVSAAPLVPARN
jgi:hypothetical protein